MRLGRERRYLVLLGIICLALIGGALYMQIVLGEAPCPLCILQRYALLLIAIFAFIGAAMRTRRSITVFETLVVICALAGVGGGRASRLHPVLSGGQLRHRCAATDCRWFAAGEDLPAGLPGRRFLLHAVPADPRSVAGAVGAGGLRADRDAGAVAALRVTAKRCAERSPAPLRRTKNAPVLVERAGAFCISGVR